MRGRAGFRRRRPGSLAHRIYSSAAEPSVQEIFLALWKNAGRGRVAVRASELFDRPTTEG